MTIPRFLSSSFQFFQDLGVTDVATIITSLQTRALAQAPPWTNPIAGTLVSPVDSAGRFMQIVLTATTALRLHWVVKDQNNIIVADREIDIDAVVPTTVNTYLGQYHCYLETLRAPTPEWAAAFMLDPFEKYALNENQNYVMGNATRNAAGTVDGQGGTFDLWWMLQSGALTSAPRVRAVGGITNGGTVGLLDFSGDPQFFPMDIQNIPNGITLWSGTAYQCYVTSSSIPSGVVKPVAIDNATPALFRTTVAPANSYNMRLAIRVG